MKLEADRTMKLSSHFSLSELTRSQTAARKGIDNNPSLEQLINLVYVANVLEQVRALFDKPVFISSGFRCSELNRAIGGATKSDHIEGLAADFIVSGVSNSEVFEAIRSSDIQYSKLINEFPKSGRGWIHLSIHKFAEAGKQSNLLAEKINHKTVYRNVA